MNKTNDIINIYKIINVRNNRTNNNYTLYDVKCEKCGHIFTNITLQNIHRLSDYCTNHIEDEKMFTYKNIKWHSTKIRRMYSFIVDSCYNKNSDDYRFYGEKGITVCDEWLSEPQKFNDWILSLISYEENFVLKRKDTTKEFSPENCIVTTNREAAKWKSTTTSITVNEITDSGKGWARRLNVGINHINKYVKKHGIEQTEKYIANLLNGNTEKPIVTEERKITVDGITDNGVGWAKRLGYKESYINHYVNKYGIDKTVEFIEQKLNPQLTIKETQKPKKKESKKEIIIRKEFCYKQIKRLPRYFVTRDFHIYDTETDKILNEYKTNSGHFFVSIFNEKENRTSAWVHKLVYESFYGEIEKGYDIHHIDENKENNNILNLQKLTHTEHCKLHNPYKYKDTTTICPQCGKEFVWTAKQQSDFYRNINRKNTRNKSTTDKPFCSKKCIGLYGREKQLSYGSDIIRREIKQKPLKEIDYDFHIKVYNDNFEQVFETMEECCSYFQETFNLTKYRANEAIRRCLRGERKQYKGYFFEIIKL